MRRAHMSNFFSKASVRRLEPLVRKTVDKLTDALQTHKGSKEPVVVSSAYSGFAVDVITEYAFAQSYNLLDDPTFQKSMHSAFSSARAGMHWIRHFPWLFDIMKRLPRCVPLEKRMLTILMRSRPISMQLNKGIVALRDLQVVRFHSSMVVGN